MPDRKVDPPRDVRETTAEYGAAGRVSATEAARGFSDLLNRVRYRGESFVIERGGEPVGELRPVAPARFAAAELASLLRSLPQVDDEFATTVEKIARAQPPAPGTSPWDS